MRGDINIGKQLAAARRGKGLRQQDLEKLSGIARTTISKIERETRDIGISVICRLADALGMEIKIVPKDDQV